MHVSMPDPSIYPTPSIDPDRASPPKPPKRSPIIFTWLFGVVLPLMAIVFESVTGICRNTFFDPLPTLFHTALFATIPLANMRMARALSLGESGLTPAWAWLHAFAFGVAILYTLVFIPLTPIAVIGVVFYGIGALGLAPLLALVCAVRGRRALKARSGAAPGKLWQGMGLALAVLLLVDTPASLTRIGAHMASAGQASTRQFGIRLLRVAGSEDALLRLCYGQLGNGIDLLGTFIDHERSLDPDQLRGIFYQVTGETFNSRPAPVRLKGRNASFDPFDADRGGAEVGGRLKSVSLFASRMDGSLDASAALGYMEWTMEFSNVSSIMQEGRATIALPPGAVVSRATLWINGEEREAAFGERSLVRQAYEKIVKQQRDPLLVTTAGTDRVLVQLFPILPNGTMKIRLGISMPMTSDGPGGVRVQLPTFSERNFELAPELRHVVWFESKTALKGSAGLTAERGPRGLSALRGRVADPQPGQAPLAIEAPGVMPAPLAWSVDDKNPDGQVIVQTRHVVPSVAPARVAVVIDGSRAMRGASEQLAQVLGAFAPNVELMLVFAGDEEPVQFRHVRGAALATGRHVQGLDFAGGRDNSAALVSAWDWASADATSGAVVWVHGPQPIAQAGMRDALKQRFQRRPGQVTLYDVALDAGPNLLAADLEGVTGVNRVARFGTLHADLQRLFAQWLPGASRTEVTRERRAADGLSMEARTSSNLTRLWAAGQVQTRAAAPGQRGAAVALANRYQLVTPVSGAVVLETQQDVAAAGLEPVEAGSVPTIPEPETWALMIVTLLALLWGRAWRRRGA